MRVRIYYNLSRAVWSIKAMEGERKGRVIGYAQAAVLRDAHTVVSEAGRQRVLREKRKNVHAYIDGTLAQVSGYQERLITPDLSFYIAGTFSGYESLYYNPYKVDHFVMETGRESTEGLTLPEVILRSDRTVDAVL